MKFRGFFHPSGISSHITVVSNLLHLRVELAQGFTRRLGTGQYHDSIRTALGGWIPQTKFIRPLEGDDECSRRNLYPSVSIVLCCMSPLVSSLGCLLRLRVLHGVLSACLKIAVTRCEEIFEIFSVVGSTLLSESINMSSIWTFFSLVNGITTL